MNALHTHFSAKALERCYRRNRSKFHSASAAGIDAVNVHDFKDDLTENTETLSARILARRYKHKKLKAFWVPKNNGEKRWICIPTIADRLVQRRLADVLMDEHLPAMRTGVGFGALKLSGADAELSAIETARLLRNQLPWVVKTDIAKFFDNLPRSSVKSSLRKVCRKTSIHWLFDGIVDVEAAGDRRNIELMRESGIERGKGLRQGMPLSPILAHIALISFDQFLLSRDIKFVRYVDDLIFFATSKAGAIHAFETARDWLESNHELSVPPIGAGNTKTEIRTPTQSVEFLGIDLYPVNDSYRLRIPQEKFSKLQSRFDSQTIVNLERPEPNQFFAAINFLRQAHKSYAGVYKNLDNWAAFSARIKELQRRGIKNISKSMCGIHLKPLSSEVFKAFGVDP